MILLGDCLETLPTLQAASVQTCVTSPPYWGLRDYGTGTWSGGDPDCDHTGQPRVSPKSTLRSASGDKIQTLTMPFLDECQRCGAERQDKQIGLEPSPEEFIDRLVDVFRAVKRVLKPDGTLWVNIGDSYASGTSGRNDGGSTYGDTCERKDYGPRVARRAPGLKQKDIVGIPWMLAFALRADGWYLRSDIIWHKPNQMPESVTDRPTKCHEYLFLLSKQERYWYNAEAVAEPAMVRRDDAAADPTRNLRSVWSIDTQPLSDAHFAAFPEALVERCILASTVVDDVVLDPFGGSGTTGKVARELARDFILCELNPDYAKLCDQRTNTTPGLPLEFI